MRSFSFAVSKPLKTPMSIINLKNRIRSLLYRRFFTPITIVFLFLLSSPAIGENFSILAPQAENIEGFIEVLKALKANPKLDRDFKIQYQPADSIASTEDQKSQIPETQRQEAKGDVSKFAEKYYGALKKALPSDIKRRSIEEAINQLSEKYRSIGPEAILYILTDHFSKPQTVPLLQGQNRNLLSEGLKVLECNSIPNQAFKIHCQFLDLVASAEDQKSQIPNAQRQEVEKNFSNLTRKYYDALRRVPPLLQQDVVASTEELEHPVLYGMQILTSMGLPSDAKEMSKEGIRENIELLRERYCLGHEAILYFLTYHLSKSQSLVVSQGVAPVPFKTRYQILIQNVLQMGYNPVPTKASECGIFRMVSLIPEEHKKTDFLEEFCKLYRGFHFEPLIQEFRLQCASMSSFLVNPIYAYLVNNPRFPRGLVGDVIDMTKAEPARYLDKYNELTIALARKCLPNNLEPVLDRVRKIEEYCKSQVSSAKDSEQINRDREEYHKAKVYFNLLKNKSLSAQNYEQINSLIAMLSSDYREAINRKIQRHQGVSLGKSVLIDLYCVLTQAGPEIQKKKEFYTETRAIPITKVKIYPKLGLSLIYLQDPALDLLPTKRYYGPQVHDSQLDFVKNRFTYIVNAKDTGDTEDAKYHKLLYGICNSSNYDFEQLAQKFQDWLNSAIIRWALH